MSKSKSDYREFKYGWPVVASSAVGIGLGMSPLPFYTLGVFVAPLMKVFGWSVSEIMLAISFFSFGGFFASPFIGYVADRWGARRTVLISIITFGLAFMTFSLNNGSLTLFYFLWVFLSIMGVGTLPITFTRAINKWFTKKRGLALGLSLLGTGLFGSLAKLYAAALIENFGWRAAYVGLALLPLLISLPLAYFFFRDTSDPKVAKKVERMAADLDYEEVETIKEVEGKSYKEALKDYRLWLLILSFLPISFAVGGPIPNIETILGAKGFTTINAVFIASTLGYAVIVGRLLGGYLIDKFWAPGVAFVMFLIPVISCLLFAQDALTYSTALIAVAGIGLAAGVEYDLMAFLVSKYFGMKNYSTIYGTIYSFFALGAGFGPFIFGKSYDMTGSYSTVFTITIFVFIIGALPLLFLGKYQYD